jgi:diguanylate cyclase (GGDEF)-like protein
MADWDVVSQDAAPAGGAARGWEPVGQTDVTPQPLRQMPDFKSENDYQGWVRQHTDAQGNFQPNDTDPSTPQATVDPYGNGSTVDLRRMYKENAAVSPVTGQYELDPTTAQMEKYQTKDSPILTKNSMYAAGAKPSQLGTWDTDDDGAHVYRPPGWVPPSETQKVMDKAVDLATKTGHDITSAVTDPDFYDPEKALDNAADFGGAALKGLGGAFHGLEEDINVLGGAGAAAYDAAHSLFVGQKPGYLTDAQDAWFRNTVDPLKDQDSAFELAKNAGLPEKVAHTFGEALGTISEAILTGGESAPLDAAKTGTDAAKAAIEHGTKAMAVPATQSAIDTGQKVYAQTGDANKALKAAQVQWLVTSAGGYVPLSAGGTLPSRLAQGAVAGTISGETGREAMNTVLPPSMQQTFDPENMTMEALSGAVMGGMGGHGGPDNTPLTKDLPTPGEMGAAGRRMSPDVPGSGPGPARVAGNINENMYNAYHQAWSAADRGDMHIADPIVDKFKAAAQAARATADANPGDEQMDAAATQAENMANALDEKVNRTAQRQADAQPSAPNKRAATAAKVNLIAQTADDSGEIKVEASDDGHVVTVNDRRVANFQTKAAAETAADDARHAVDDRRVDSAMRKKVGDMTPDEMQQELLTHPLTGIPNRRAYEESDKLPSQVSIDANSLKWINDEGGHAAGDHLLKAIATALHDETPNAYHFGGDEFVVQAKDHATAAAIMDRAKQRLAGATIEMENAAGHKITLKGIGISHGISSDLGSADRSLQLDKQRQESAGLRAARGEQPPGAHIAAPEAGLPGEQGESTEDVAGTSRVLGQQTSTPAQPTAKQAEAGNYSKGEVRYHGLPIAVENVEGQYRTGKGDDGKTWRNRLKGADYGYFKGTKANDGDGVDVFMGKQPDNGHAYVVDQLDKTGKKFDEHKVVVGVKSAEEAKALYLRHYEKGWKGFGGVTELPLEDFKKWLKFDSHEGPLDSANVPQARAARGAGPDARHDSILQFLARHPRGLDSEEAAAQGVDAADMRLPSAVVGIKRAFRKGGMSFDHAAETLHQEGYPVVDSHGQYNPNTLLDKISDELRGRAHYSVHNESNIPEASDLQQWRHAKTDAELGAMGVDELEKLHAQLEAAAERAAIQREHEHVAESDLDSIPFAKGKGGGQQDLFGDPVGIKNELKRVEAELDRKRNSGQVSVETGRPDDLFSQARKQTTLLDITDHPIEPVVKTEPKSGTVAQRLEAVEKQLGITPAKTPVTTGEKQRDIETDLVDTGEKIGGARKDKWAERGLSLTDLKDMSAGEAANLVKKAAIWKPDYEAMINDGADTRAAALVKMMYDKLGAEPRENTPIGREHYVEAMQALRKISETVKTVDDARAIQDKFLEAIGYDRSKPYYAASEGNPGYPKFWSIHKGRKGVLDVNYKRLHEAEKLIEKGWPNIEPWQRRFNVRQDSSGNFHVMAKTSYKSLGSFKTKAEAAAFAKSQYEGLSKGEKKATYVRPHLDHIKRTGPAVLSGDAKPMDFIQDFGFRGLEFGNWAANDERQKLVNHAYEALHDLARTLGIPPKALSLNGQLGLALGARGGGFGVAHYEPGKLVINMTKINGAGSMAHEWGHAVDHYFGEFGRPDAYTTQARGASGWYKDPTVRTLEHLRPEMQQAWQGVMKAIFQRDLTQAEHIRGMELANEKRQATLDQQKQRQAVAEGRPAGQRDEKFIRNNASWIRDAEKSLDRARDLLEERRALPAEPGTYGKTGTRYTKEAGDRGDYWRRPTELFARAFESYVHDKMQASGELSQYLVHSTPHEDPYPGEDRPAINAAMQKLVDTFDTRSDGDKEVLFRSGDGAKAPGGMDTAKIDAAVHKFLDKFQVPVGGVKVAKDMAELLKDPEIGPILERAGADAANTDHRIAFVHPRTGKMYFVADQIHSLDHVASLVAHEYITHFGLRAAFGNSRAPEYQAILDGVVKAMPADVRARGRREFGPSYNHMDRGQRNVAAEEALAYYGQRYADGQSVPARLSRWIDRAVAMIRDWLRNVMGLPKKFDELFIRRTLGDLEAFLRRGKDRVAGGAADHGPAFAGKKDTFYSGLAKAVDAAKREKGTGAEWEATLRNMPGVKAEEMAWTGIKDWLEGRGKVSKAEVAEYVAAHQVQLGEVHLGEPANLDSVTSRLHELGYMLEENEDGEPTLEHIADGADDHLTEEEFAANENKAMELLASLQRGGGGVGEARIAHVQEWLRTHNMNEFNPQEVNHLRAGGQAAGDLTEVLHRVGYPEVHEMHPGALEHEQQMGMTQYKQYATPGGENYREMLMTLQPRVSDANQAYTAHLQSVRDRLAREHGEDYGYSNLHEEMTPQELETEEKLRIASSNAAVKSSGGKFVSGHWEGHPNILAHVRFDDRIGPNGEKILHVHEVQSDWHQAGRRHGYASKEAAQRPSVASTIQGAREAIARNDDLGFDSVGQAMNAIATHDDWVQRWEVPPDDVAAINAWREVRLAQMQHHVDAQNAVPDAPFKTTWAELAMKRMLRMAVEGGYDKLSWDTGDTNAERYNMSHVVDLINVRKNLKTGLYDMVAKKGDHTVREEYGMSEEKLASMIGKEAAQKAVQRSDDGDLVPLTGNDLKVGGHGMRGFYDNILPKAVSKLVKKWGSSVEPGQVGGQHSASKYLVQDPIPGGNDKYVAYNPNDQYDFKEFDTREEAMQFAEAGPAGRDLMAAHVVDITPQMRDSVMEGQPMFARGDDVEDRRTDDDRLFGREGAGGKAYGLVRRAAGSMVDNRLVGDIAKILNPKDISAFSKEAAMRTSAFLGELAHQKQVAQEHLQQFSRAVNKLSPNDQLAMIHAIETGAPQPIAAMQPVADALRKMLDTWRDNVRALGEGHLENFIDNYFPHWWRDQKNAASVFASIQGRRTMSGPKTFLKKRVIPTTKEGIEYGLKPITTNPLVLTLLKIHEMQRFISGVTMMRAYKDAGLAKFVPATKSVDDGWKEINDPIARVSSWSEEEGGFIQRGRYAMPEDAARIVNNHLSKSALSDFAPAQAIRTASNILNSMQLGFSAFHLGFTTMDAMVSKNALALERLVAGEPLKALAAFAEGVTPAGAVMNVARGLKLMRAYTNPAGATPDMKALINALTAGGGRVHMDRFYLANEGVSPFRGVGPRSLMEDMRMALTQPHGKVAAATKAIGSFPVEYAQELWNGLAQVAKIYPAWQLPFELLGRTTRASSAWIMEHLVPMQKLGVFADMANDFLRRSPNATPEEVSNAMQAAWRSVDNRMGEMVYDSLYWNRTFKDAAHLSMRAVGWNWGDWREIGGAPFELLKNINDGIRDGKMPKLGHKSAYVMGLIFTQALVGAFLGYLYGQPPKSLKDYMFPRTGRFQQDGTAERVSLPSYVKDIYEYYMHPVDTVAHKANPWIGLVWDEVQDLDYFGHPIYNPKDSEREEWIERLTYAAKAFRPFSLGGQKQMVGASEPGWTGAMFSASPYFGITPAPGLVTKPEKMAEFEHYKQEKAWKDKLKFELKQAQKSGDKAAIHDAQKKLNDLRPAEVKERAQYLHDKAKAKKDAAAGKTSAIMDKVGPLIDSSSSRAEMAQKIHAAGYPALAGLIGSLPDQLRPQVADAIEREAT